MLNENERWSNLDKLLLRPSKLANNEFEPGEELKNMLFDYVKILVIGAGGLGCEILKNLAFSGFKDIHIIDLDKIELTNLNRQFLFREADIGKYKSTVAAEFINKRCPGVKVTAYTKPIQEYDQYFYEEFPIIIAGLDNIEARRWLNALLVSMVQFDENGNPDLATLKPLIDGGTEAFGGQVRVILPGKNACFECTLGTLPPQVHFPLCTIRENPRLPEHCIQYALVVHWPNEFSSRKYDTDSSDDMLWIYEKSLERANIFGILGVTYMLTLGVAKNIIPAIASTNAIIAGACVNEALKVATYCSQVLDNNFMYMGQTGTFSNTFAYERNPECLVCSGAKMNYKLSKTLTLQQFIENLKEDSKFNLKNPCISNNKGMIYIPHPPSLEQQHHFKLDLTFIQLIQQNFMLNNDEFFITDVSLPTQITLKLELID